MILLKSKTDYFSYGLELDEIVKILTVIFKDPKILFTAEEAEKSILEPEEKDLVP
jgi:hypothetical protein